MSSEKIKIEANSRPTPKKLLPFLDRIASKWYKLGIALLEEGEEAHLKVIKANNSDVSSCCLEMLQYWTESHPEATWHHLVTKLRSPGVNLAAVAFDIEKQFTVDHESTDTSAAINFADLNVVDAFTKLKTVFKNELSDADFSTICEGCLSRAIRRLRSEMEKITNIHDLFKLLACNPIYFNWMNVQYLRTIAVASDNKKLQDMVKQYNDFVLSKTLGEIWNSIPSFYPTRTKYYSEVKTKFNKKNPNNVTVKDLLKHQPRLARKIALHIMKIRGGSLTITWCILAEETYQAYLLALNIPRELRQDDFLQIGPWVAFHPQFVIQELKKVHGMMTTSTLLIGYYHGLLMKSIDAGLLTDKMCSVKLLTANEYTAISSGHSIHHRNWMLLEHVRHMDMQAVMKFCELVQEIWPQVGSQLIISSVTDSPHSDQSALEVSDTKHYDMEVTDTYISSSAYILFLHLIDQVVELLQSHTLELLQSCQDLKASDVHNINLFSTDQMKELSEYSEISFLLVKLSPLFTWSNHSILRALIDCCSEAVELLDKFESHLDPFQPITSYPIPCLSLDMIPGDTSTYTILAVRCKVELHESSLQYIYGVQSVMIEMCDITQHCLQLLAVRSDPTILYWTIPKCVVDLINTNVPLHSEYLYSNGLLEVVIYPDLLLTTGDDVCYGSLVFKCRDQLFCEKVNDSAILNQEKEHNTEVMLKHFRSKCDELTNELNNKTKLAKDLEEALESLQKQRTDVDDEAQKQSTEGHIAESLQEVTQMLKNEDHMETVVPVSSATSSDVSQLKATTSEPSQIFLHKPKMIELIRIVIPRIQYDWEDVAYVLHYEKPLIEWIRRNHEYNPKKCCRELFIDWLSTRNGAEPKKWSTLLDKLKEVEELTAAREEIMEELIKMQVSSATLSDVSQFTSEPLTYKRRMPVSSALLSDVSQFTSKPLKTYTRRVPVSSATLSDVSQLKATTSEPSKHRQMPVSSAMPSDVSQLQATTSEPSKPEIFFSMPEMFDLYRIVIPRIQPYWENVAYALLYEISVVEIIRQRHKDDPRKCCMELFEDWLTTSHGAKPKIWSTLLDKLKEVKDLTAAREKIMEELIKSNA